MFEKKVDYFSMNLSWIETKDPFYPYELRIGGTYLKIRLNDFPEEVMYSLLVDEELVKDFNNWPSNWKR